MRLDIGTIKVADVEFGAKTTLRDHTLVIDRDEIRALVLEDSHFQDVEVHLAKPGDSVRLLNVGDVVEPRWKVRGPGSVFPGFLSPPVTVGEGQTNRLAGVAVVEVSPRVPGGSPLLNNTHVMDMSGPAAEYGPFGRTLNVVLDLKPNPEAFPPGSEVVPDLQTGSPASYEYYRAVRIAGLKVAAHLGKTSASVTPDEMETFELGPCDPTLPRFVFLYHVARTSVYGAPIPLALGTLMHPNEFFDGAVSAPVVFGTAASVLTFADQNNEMLMGLCREHGRTLNFVGCVLYGYLTPGREEKERLSSSAAKMARLLGAQVAILLGTVPGSHLAIDLMLTLQKVEQSGIKTILCYPDLGSGADDTGFSFTVPEADAIVCTGSRLQQIALPAMQKVFGGGRFQGVGAGDSLLPGVANPAGELSISLNRVPGAISPNGRLTTRFY